MRTIKIVSAFLLLAFVAINSFGQTEKVTEKKGKKPVKTEKSKVPAVVTETFVREYPTALYDNWYGYPAFANESDWYGYNPYLYAEYPEYYVVEFTENAVPNKVIYSKGGKKIATHRKLNSPLPEKVTASIHSGEYKSWKLMNDKEEIFKDGDADNLKVYKVEVEKGTQKHILLYLSDGKLLTDKKVA